MAARSTESSEPWRWNIAISRHTIDHQNEPNASQNFTAEASTARPVSSS